MFAPKYGVYDFPQPPRYTESSANASQQDDPNSQSASAAGVYLESPPPPYQP